MQWPLKAALVRLWAICDDHEQVIVSFLEKKFERSVAENARLEEV